MDQPKSFIQIAFSDIGSVLLDINMSNVVPLQLLAAADYLRHVGEAGLVSQDIERSQSAQRNKIVVPGLIEKELLK